MQNNISNEKCDIRVIHENQIETARQNTLSEPELDRLTGIFKLLGDPNRLKIVLALSKVEMCVCDLAAFLDASESAVSHQLRRLKDLKLVKYRKEGPICYYSLKDEHVADILGVAVEHVKE